MSTIKRVQFPHRTFQLQKELGQGACGRTVLLYDETIDEYLVCKKYTPFEEAMRAQLYAGFVREIKLLHSVNHVNVVRLFNYLLYPDRMVGYIFMEYVEGSDIEEYLEEHPEQINEIFAQTIDGFAYLEGRRVLHRDIRPANVLVSNEGVVKIIDFGFGKAVPVDGDFDKSVSLNWWCDPPPEFADNTYDHITEIYFVGKLFERLLLNGSYEDFWFRDLLRSMIEPDRDRRLSSFSEAREVVMSKSDASIAFEWEDRDTYRSFAAMMSSLVTKIGSDAKYLEIDDVLIRLRALYKSVMLEEYVPAAEKVVQCLLTGKFYYSRKVRLRVETLLEFIDLLKRSSSEKRSVRPSTSVALTTMTSRFRERWRPRR